MVILKLVEEPVKVEEKAKKAPKKLKKKKLVNNTTSFLFA